MNITPTQFAINMAALASQILVPVVGGRTQALTIKKLDEIPATIPERNCPVLIPAYTFQTGLSTPRESMGEDAFRQKNWTANYVLVYAPVGTNRTGMEYNSRIASAIDALTQVVVANPTALGVNDVSVSGDSAPLVIQWVNGDNFYAANIQIAVEDFRNL